MTTAFDPSAFIEAERRAKGRDDNFSGTLAGTLADPETGFEPEKGKGFRRFQSDPEKGLATLATLAGVRADEPGVEGHIRRMATWPAPWTMGSAEWDRLTWIAAETWDRWGQQAVALGWSDLHIFGCCPQIDARRLDMDGIVKSLSVLHVPMMIEEVTADRWRMVGRRGEVQHYYRFPLSGAVPLWVAYAPAGGP